MNPDVPTAAATALLTAVDDPDWPRLLGGNPRMLTAVLRDDPPDSLVDHVLTAGDPGHLADLARSAPVAERRPDVPDRLVAVVPPETTGDGLLHWEYRHWETLLGRRPPGAPLYANLPFRLDTVLAHSRNALDCGHAIERHGGRLTEREQVHALATHHQGTEDDVLHATAVAANLPVGARVKAALAEPRGLGPLIAELDDTGTAIAALRDPQIPQYLAVAHARERPELGWGRVAAAHREKPFGALATAALAGRGDCPQELLLDFFAKHPDGVADATATLPLSLLKAKSGHLLVRRFLDAGRGAELIAHGRPAAAILKAVNRTYDPTFTPFHGLLRRLLADTVSDDPGAWRALRQRLGGHRGTVAELCEDAAAKPAADGPWPEQRTGPHQVFRAFLDAATTATQLHLLPHLDHGTLTDLFTHGVWRREWFDHVVEYGTPDLRLSFAHTHHRLGVARVQRLLDLGEPALTAALFGRQDLSVAQIEHVLSGRAFPGSVLPATFKARLMATTSGWHARHAIACADPELQRHILEHAPVRGLVPQLRLLLNVWDRHGRDTMLASARRPDVKITTLKHVREATADELRAYLAERETPAWQLERLRMTHDFHRESHDWHHAEILAELDREPTFAKDILGIRDSPGVPTPLRLKAPERPEIVALDDGATSAEVFCRHPQEAADDTRSWIRTAVATARLTWGEILHHGRPAAFVLAARPDPADLRDLVGDLTPEALLLALEMLDGFTGTVPELLATARAVTLETP